uniref:Gypsy retrotransposon integrase-like protein 1 n=1 Tax=Xenopus tropicalis TaxID=8364 RepID=A0A803JCG3_XENTR
WMSTQRISFRVPYMGHLLTAEGLRPDPDKVKAILEMPNPENVQAVQRMLGFVNYLSKFLPHLSDVCEPLRRLTDKDSVWVWQSSHDKSMEQIKKLVTAQPVLRYYDVNEEVTVQCDASEKGLGATLMQQGQPVAFASRTLSPTEQRYAQIEKECLAIVFGCQKFDQYLVIIPKTLCPEMIARIHSSHLGIDACLRKAKDVLFWPHMGPEIIEAIKDCDTCNE